MIDTFGIIMRSINSKSLQKLVLIHLGDSGAHERKTKQNIANAISKSNHCYSL